MLIKQLSIFFILLFLSSGASAHKRQVALTFDDGPVIGTTDKILDILKKEKVPATFFVVGSKAEKYPELIGRITLEAHELGNHSYSHARYPNGHDIAKTSALLKQLSGRSVKVYRPPYGKIKRASRKYLEKNHYRVVLWTLAGGDYERNNFSREVTPDIITNRILNRVRKREIILLHDDNSNTAKALSGIIKGLKQRGYKFLTVSQMRKNF